MPFKFLKSLVEKFTDRPVDWDELEETLIRADLGVPMAMRIMDSLRERGGELTASVATAVTRHEIEQVLPEKGEPVRPTPGKPAPVLMIGVNGTGKTTTSAKLANSLVRAGNSVLLVAADTFRAAAIEQLAVWGERIGVDVIKGNYNGDPSALCYDAYIAAQKRNADFLICDTAGRLHTKNNLMQELAKVVRTLGKHEVQMEKLLVVDATTGTNALVQAKEFHQAVGLTGVVVTKLDGSGRGGVLVAIQNELGIPPRYIGTGEQLGDIALFDRKAFLDGIL